jgi:Meckel syndrome type 1 protein
MVAGPAGQVLAATGTTGDGERAPTASPADRAIGGQGGGLMLKVGSTGAAVQAIQERLGVPADGLYGPVTEGAVRDFQTDAQILADGVVGPITWTKLFGLDRAAASAGAARGTVAVIVREREPAGREPAAREQVVREPAGRNAGRTVPTVGRAPSAVPPPGAPRSDREAQAPAARPAPAPPASGACGELRLAAPVKGVRTSPFGPRWGRNHDGVDIAAPTGTPVRAAECGVVTVRGAQGGYGNMVCVEHSSRFETCYAHLSSFAVNGGQTVRRGQVIGYVGCTGSCTGPHVHFETRVDGRAQNPDAYLRGGSVPGRPRVSQASNQRTAKASAGPMGSEWQRAAPASETGSAMSVRQPSVKQSAPEPVEQQAPVVAEPESVVAEPEPVVAEPEPVVAEPESVVAEPEPVVAEPESVVAEPEPLVAEPESVVAEPEPLVAEPEPVVAEQAPVVESLPEAPVADAPPEAPVAEAPGPGQPPAPAPVESAPVAPELPTPAAATPQEAATTEP